jgi:hypothetical protein
MPLYDPQPKNCHITPESQDSKVRLPLLRNDLVNTYPRQRIRKQQSSNFHSYAMKSNSLTIRPLTLMSQVLLRLLGYLAFRAAFTLSYGLYREYCDLKNVDLHILTDLLVFSSLTKKKWYLNAVYLYVCR